MNSPLTIVYVSCDADQELAHFRMDDVGILTRCGTTPLPVGDGDAVPVVTELASLRTTGAPLAVSPDRAFLYASIRTTPFRVMSYRINPVDGELSTCGEAPLPASTPFIVTDRAGRYLLGAAYNGNMLWVAKIDRATGAASSPMQTVDGIVTPHFILLQPDNRRAYVAATGHSEILVHDFDPASGRLSFAGSTPFAGSDESTPRHLALHPHRPWLYAINETSGTIDGFRITPEDGALIHFTRVACGFPEETSAHMIGADLHISSDGRLLFSSERSRSRISVFLIDIRSGELSLIQRVPAGAIPRSFQIDPSGRFLVAAGQGTSEIIVFAIDTATGRLEVLATYETGKRPTWIEIVSL